MKIFKFIVLVAIGAIASLQFCVYLASAEDSPRKPDIESIDDYKSEYCYTLNDDGSENIVDCPETNIEIEAV